MKIIVEALDYRGEQYTTWSRTNGFEFAQLSADDEPGRCKYGKSY